MSDMKRLGLKESSVKNVLRRRIYRIVLSVALLLSCSFLALYGYFLLDSRIPSVIFVRSGEAEHFDLNLPAKGEITSVSYAGKSNIPEGAVLLDLSEEVTLKTCEMDECSMVVKLFGFLPFKQVGIQVVEEKELIPMGVPVGIYMESDGILVIGVGEFQGLNGQTQMPARHLVKSGDYIRKLNGVEITKKEELIEGIKASEGAPQVLTVDRNGQLIDMRIVPKKDVSGEYRIGVWVRDSAQGVGTMTYMDADGNFGALGHGISDVDTSTIMKMTDGTLYRTKILSVEKGRIGHPGEMTGMIIYSDENVLGDILYNGEEGIFGRLDEDGKDLSSGTPVPVGYKQEIKKEPAQILCTVDGQTKYYDVEITGIQLDHDNINRGIELKVTDQELLERTGGIVQGMSGSPIIQDGKLIGAVTHVLIQDCTRGYGIFIENMLEHDN